MVMLPAVSENENSKDSFDSSSTRKKPTAPALVIAAFKIHVYWSCALADFAIKMLLAEPVWFSSLIHSQQHSSSLTG